MTATVTLVGNLTRDPEMRYLPSGAQNATFGLAVNRVWNDRQSNERKEVTSFFDVVCWRDLADNVCESLSKGTRVIVSGRLEQRSWEDKEGKRQSKVEVVADEVGPSLRWATADISKTERRGPDSGGRPVSNEPQQGATDTSGGGGYSYDEEPF